MLEFLQYLGKLLITAFWNPNSLFISAVSWIGTIYAIVFFVVPQWRKPMVRRLGWIKKYRWGILAILIFFSVVLASYTMQNSVVDWQNNRPFLAFQQQLCKVSVWNDNAAANFGVEFPVQNTGDSIAYQVETTLYVVPSVNIQIQTLQRFEYSDINQLLPGSQRTYNFGFNTPLQGGGCHKKYLLYNLVCLF